MREVFTNKKKSILIFLICILPICTDIYAQSLRDTIQNIKRLKNISHQYEFAVIGDSRDGEKIYQHLIKDILSRKPAFIIHLGDMISKPSEEEWEVFFKVSEHINIPFFPVAGNHDIGTKLGLELYKSKFLLPDGKTYYSFKVGDVLFAILDSEIGQGRIIDEQWLWLRDTLNSSNLLYKLVFLHRPLFLPMDSIKQGKAMDRFPDERDQLHQLFLKTKVKAVFSGDDHRYYHSKKDEIYYIITGGGGAPLYAKRERGGYFHYVLVSFDGKNFEIKVINLNGEVQERFILE